MEVLLEITMKNLLGTGKLDYEDFLSRVDTMTSLGYNVLVSNYFEFYRLSAYFRRYTEEWLGIVLGINNLAEIFNEEYYDDLEGGILESFGRLFKEKVRLYIYPMLGTALARYQDQLHPGTANAADTDSMKNNFIITARNFQVQPNLKNLFLYLWENHFIEAVESFNKDLMMINSRDILNMIREGIPDWEKAVPPEAVRIIKDRKMFGYQP